MSDDPHRYCDCKGCKENWRRDKRAELAGRAMQAFIEPRLLLLEGNADRVAKQAVAYADALIARLEKP